MVKARQLCRCYRCRRQCERNDGSAVAVGTGSARLSYGRQRLCLVLARLRVAQSGLGRAGHWLVQAVAQALVQAAQGCSKGD